MTLTNKVIIVGLAIAFSVIVSVLALTMVRIGVESTTTANRNDSENNNSTLPPNENKREMEAAPVVVDVGGEPLQSEVQTGMGGSLMTKYLPINITQVINLPQPIKNTTIYQIFTDWDGIVRPDNNIKWLMHDENKKSVSFDGYQTLALYAVNATCIEPYFVQVLGSDLGEDGIQLGNTTTATPSRIAWGNIIQGSFAEPQDGTIYFTQAGYGIVPADYNNNNDNTYRNNGAGNQQLSGTYHLSFTSFYTAKINLPEKATLTSFKEVTCSISEDSIHIQKSKFPNIFVYDVWFRIP